MDLEELIANKLVILVEQKVDERLKQMPKAAQQAEFLNQARMCERLNMSAKTFHDKIMPLAPPTIVVRGLVRYPVKEFDVWFRDNFLVMDGNYIPAKARMKK